MLIFLFCLSSFYVLFTQCYHYLWIVDCPFGLLYCLFNTESFVVDCLINSMYVYYSVLILAVLLCVSVAIIISLIYRMRNDLPRTLCSKYQNLFNLFLFRIMQWLRKVYISSVSFI